MHRTVGRPRGIRMVRGRRGVPPRAARVPRRGPAENWAELSVHGPGSDAQAAFSREFCGALARARLAHPELAEGVRRRRRHAVAPRDPLRGDVARRRAARLAVHERELDRPDDHEVRQRGAEGVPPAEDLRGQRALVSGLLGARGRQRPRLAAHRRGALGRRLRRERLEDLDLVRGRRRVLLPARAHRPELEAPPRHQRAARADERARDRRCARCPR